MITCLIPARGGSKSIPYKNIIDIHGEPLIYWVLRAANASKIDKIYVSTDDDDIKYVVETFGFDKVEVIGRSDEVSTDEATTESVMLEFYNKYKPENLVLIQPTSPLLSTEHINGALDKYKEGKYDSLLTLVRRKQFRWDVRGNICLPNYTLSQRPRRQDYDGDMIENGAFYVTKGKWFEKCKIRVSGNSGYYEMPEYTLCEIDEAYDVEIIDRLLEIYG
jgi:N-acylneuraminate cytidylyltransferase